MSHTCRVNDRVIGCQRALGTTSNRSSASHVIHAPDARTGRCKHQEDKAEQHRRFAAVEDWRKDVAFRRVANEVSEGHLSRQQKRRKSGKQANQQQRAENQLEDAHKPIEGHGLQVVEHCHVRHVKQLCRRMLQKQKCGHNSQHGKNAGSPCIVEGVRSISSPIERLQPLGHRRCL